MHRPQEALDRAATDLPSVLDAFLDGAAEVNADQDPRESILVRRFRKTGVGAQRRRRVGACASGRQRQAARREAISSEPKNRFKTSAAAPPSTLCAES